jgi:CheY-like chemotaxis protein
MSSSDSPLGAGCVLTLTGNGNCLELSAEVFRGQLPAVILLDLMMPQMERFIQKGALSQEQLPELVCSVVPPARPDKSEAMP